MTELIHRKRQQGKTNEMIARLLADRSSVILVSTAQEANWVRRRITEVLTEGLGTAGEWLVVQLDVRHRVIHDIEDLRSRGDIPVYVDNADRVLDRLLNGKLAGATWNKDE